MKKRVYNTAVGKIFRTLGLLLVLVSSIYLATRLALNPAHADLPFIGNISGYAQMVDDILVGITFLNETAYVFLFLSIGLIMLTWAIRRGIILRVLLTGLLVAGFVIAAAVEETLLAPIVVISPAWLLTLLQSLDTLIDNVLAMNDYLIPGVALATAFLLSALFSSKRPRRIYLLFLKVGTGILLLAVLMYFVANTLMTDLLDMEIYVTIMVSNYLLTYLMFAVGGIFGVIGFMRK